MKRTPETPLITKEPAGPWTCDECGEIGRINANGTRECFSQACINFPYMTHLNIDAMEKRLGRSLRTPPPPKPPANACGTFWMTDYGPAYCDQGRGHSGEHRCWGSQGAITWRPL